MSYVRRTARVLLVDGSDRLLLMRFRFRPGAMPRPYGWLTPGGGVQDGEALAITAARELGEEVGLDVSAADLGEPVAYTGGYADLGWAAGEFRDDFFYLRVHRHDVDTSRMEDLEMSVHAGERWWSVDELAATDEIVYPYDLVPLLTELLSGRRPAEPVALPWHHAPDPTPP
ncbi:MAG TPA: NUDIX domain-containing protein [Micromonosporaceae bacterium]|nr:NUDIX domain-containing protein [Micromonosporaceae bacterium]